MPLQRGPLTLVRLSASVVNTLALLPEEESRRLAARDVEFALRSQAIGYFVGQLARKLAPGGSSSSSPTMDAMSYEDFGYLSRDIVLPDVMMRLTPERVRFLRLHVPDALARQIHSDQLSTMMMYTFIFNRNPPSLAAGSGGRAGAGEGGGGKRVGGVSATKSVALVTSAAASIVGEFDGTRPVSGRRDVRRRRSGGGDSAARERGGELGTLGALADGYTETMFKVSLADVDRLLAFPVAGAAKEP